jgi:hypothetical protein
MYASIETNNGKRKENSGIDIRPSPLGRILRSPHKACVKSDGAVVVTATYSISPAHSAEQENSFSSI